MSTTAALAPPARPSDSAAGAALAGWLIIALFFGGFGAWAVTAPLNAAVVGEAVVKVAGNRKSVQHVDGGTVREINVAEGGHVTAGDIVMVLDDTETRAQVEVLRSQHVLQLAIEARLAAELAGAASVSFPASLTDARSDPSVQAAMDDQVGEFDSRRDAMSSRQAVLGSRIQQYEAQIAGLENQRAPLTEQLNSVTTERASLDDLLKRGLTTKARIFELDRSASTLAGQLGEIDANIEVGKRGIEEVRQQIAQLGTENAADVTAQLREVRAKIADIAPRLETAATTLERSAVRAPYSGTVVDLAVFSIGAVVRPGERLLDIVPDDTLLDVEARIRVEDISDLKPGMRAEVHFTSYKQRITPIIHGTVADISADRLTDERTQMPYYVALIDVDQAELAASPEIDLYPGMPATVMITTQERTALDYLIGPLAASFERSFRER